ncbi:MAG: methyltransferase domain-containing protein [Alphaproteobacteria bacterium]|nr:methyltransferase domain-containing protein [Alphaproteobacteria bacterium]
MSVVSHFSNAAQTYDGAADIQREIAEKLAAHIVRLTPRCEDLRILEIGCGTGLLTSHLEGRFRDAASLYMVSDYSQAMIEVCREKIPPIASLLAYLACNGERLPFKKPTFDLIVSSMVFQWFKNPAQSILRMRELLKPGGHIIYSTVGSNNFPEWRQFLESKGLTCGMRDDLPKSYPGEFQNEHIIKDYENAHGFLEMLRATGANKPRDGHKSKSIREFLKRINDYNGVATWHIVYGALPAATLE